jgi:hypothetical protein
MRIIPTLLARIWPTQQAGAKSLAAFLVVSTGIILSVFFFRSFNLAAEMQTGRQLAKLSPSIVWNDFPVSIYTSKDAHHTNVSSSQLFNAFPDPQTFEQELLQQQIRYIVVSGSDRSLAHSILPDLLLSHYINTDNLSLHRIYNSKEDDFIQQYPALVQHLVAMNRSYLIWEVHVLPE